MSDDLERAIGLVSDGLRVAAMHIPTGPVGGNPEFDAFSLIVSLARRAEEVEADRDRLKARLGGPVLAFYCRKQAKAPEWRTDNGHLHISSKSAKSGPAEPTGAKNVRLYECRMGLVPLVEGDAT